MRNTFQGARHKVEYTARDELRNKLENQATKVGTTIGCTRRRTTVWSLELLNTRKKLHEGKGNIISRIEKIKELGAETTKQIDEKYLED